MGHLHDRLRYICGKTADAARSDGGRNVWLYLLCVLIAFVFWALMSLDNEVQRDFDVPLELNDVPDSITVINDLPPSLSVGVKAKGSQLLRFIFSSSVPSMRIKFEPQAVKGNRLVISKARLESRLREYFGSGVTISSCRPDSLSVLFTDLPGRRVRLAVDADIHPDLQCVISGRITASVDSVTVYSTGDLPRDLTHVSTEPIVKTGLTDTTRYDVRVVPLAGMRIEPSTVTVTVPVEPLISKKRMIPVEILNKPSDINVILFPSKVGISYLVPISDYNEDYPMQAYVDYKEIRTGVSKLGLILSSPSPMMRNVSLATDSVEFIIERR